MNIYVGNLAGDVTEDDLRQLLKLSAKLNLLM